MAKRLPPAGLYDRVIREVERPLIAISLAAARGNQIRAAQLLGLNRNTLRKKIRISAKLGVEVIPASGADFGCGYWITRHANAWPLAHEP